MAMRGQSEEEIKPCDVSTNPIFFFNFIKKKAQYQPICIPSESKIIPSIITTTRLPSKNIIRSLLSQKVSKGLGKEKASMHSLGFNLQPSPVQSKPKILKPRHSSTSNRPHETEQGPSSSAGKIKRLVLSNEGRTKLNLDPDRDFYSYPRFVNHVDDRFISALTDLYRQRVRPGSVVLDLMSSWVSHLPEEVKYEKVVGHGLNAQELARNPRLDYFFVKDLNEDQRFEFDDQTFDSVLCSVGVQYLQEPEKVFAEANRVMKAGGVFIVSFSNRMFYEKAVREWREGSGYSRVQLVVQYFQCVEGFTQPEVVRGGDQTSVLDRLLGFLGLSSGPDPFYALVAYKSFKPLYH